MCSYWSQKASSNGVCSRTFVSHAFWITKGRSLLCGRLSILFSHWVFNLPDLFTVQLIFFTIIFSLFFQNAMRAVVEQHGSSVDIPPLKVLITKGRQDLTVKVCNLTDEPYLLHSACSNVASQFLATSLRFFLRCTPNSI